MVAFETFTPIPAGPDGRRIRAPIYRATRPVLSKRKNKVLDSSDEEIWSSSSEDGDEQDEFKRVTFRRQQSEACEGHLDMESKSLSTLHSIRTWVYFRRSQLEILEATHPQEKEDGTRLVSMWNDLAPHIKDEWNAKADEYFEQEMRLRRDVQLKREQKRHEKWLDRQTDKWRQTARRTSLSDARRRQSPPTTRVVRARLDAQQMKYGALGPTPPGSLASTPYRACTPLPPLEDEDLAAFADKYSLQYRHIEESTLASTRSPTLSVSAPSLLDPASPRSVNSDDTVYAAPPTCKEHTPVPFFAKEHRHISLSLPSDRDLNHAPDVPSPQYATDRRYPMVHDASQAALVAGLSDDLLNLLPHLSPAPMQVTGICDPLCWTPYEHDLQGSSDILDPTRRHGNQQSNLNPDMNYFMSDLEISMLTANIPDPCGLPEVNMMDFRLEDLLGLPAGPIPNDIDVSVDLAKAIDSILNTQFSPTQSSGSLLSGPWHESVPYVGELIPTKTAYPNSPAIIYSANQIDWQVQHHQQNTSSNLPRNAPTVQHLQTASFHCAHVISPAPNLYTSLDSSQIYPIYDARSKQDVLPTHVFIPADY